MGYLKRRLEKSLSRRNLLVLAGLSFLAVYREAAETVLFTQALLLEADGQRGQVWAGAAAGVDRGRRGGCADGADRACACRSAPSSPFPARCSAPWRSRSPARASTRWWRRATSHPRPVSFPEVPWLGIHPDLTGLARAARDRNLGVRRRARFAVAPAAGACGRGRGRSGPTLSEGPVLTLLGAPDCHLCHDMRGIVERVLAQRGGVVVERNVHDDPALLRRYRFDIPILLLGERELARHRVTEAELVERLDRAQAD